MLETIALVFGSGAGAVAMWKTVQLIVDKYYASKAQTKEIEHAIGVSDAEFSGELWEQLKILQAELSDFKSDTIADLKLEIDILGAEVEELKTDLDECREEILKRIDEMNQEAP